MSEKKTTEKEIAPVIEDKPVEKAKPAKPVNKRAFVARKLRAINEMSNAAKARAHAKRILGK